MQIILGMLIKGGTGHKILHRVGRVEEKTYTGLTLGQVCMVVKVITLNKLVLRNSNSYKQKCLHHHYSEQTTFVCIGYKNPFLPRFEPWISHMLSQNLGAELPGHLLSALLFVQRIAIYCKRCDLLWRFH